MLYKVSSPRGDLTFTPTRFWRTADWRSSSTRPRAGYLEETVLYAAEFDEVNIHLLPPVRRLRVWLTPESMAGLQALGYGWPAACRALLLVHEADRAQVEGFCPTVFTFAREGFEPVPSHEYVSREARTALSCETLTMAEAIRRWQMAITYVADLSAVAAGLEQHGILYSEQTP